MAAASFISIHRKPHAVTSFLAIFSFLSLFVFFRAAVLPDSGFVSHEWRIPGTQYVQSRSLPVNTKSLVETHSVAVLSASFSVNVPPLRFNDVIPSSLQLSARVGLRCFNVPLPHLLLQTPTFEPAGYDGRLIRSKRHLDSCMQACLSLTCRVSDYRTSDFISRHTRYTRSRDIVILKHASMPLRSGIST